MLHGLCEAKKKHKTVPVVYFTMIMGGSCISNGPIIVAVVRKHQSPVSDFTWSHMFLLLCTSTSLYTSSVITSHGRTVDSLLNFERVEMG